MSSESTPREYDDKDVTKKRKINKACVNCRKRKIKCSGSAPCTNCITYKCSCEFTQRRIRNTGAKKVTTPVILDDNYPSRVSPSDVQDSPAATRPLLGRFTNNNLSFKDNLLDPKYSRTNMSLNNVLSPNTLSRDTTSVENNASGRGYSIVRTPMYATTSDRSWRPGSNSPSLISNYEHVGVYGGDLEEQEEYIVLSKTLKQLRTLKGTTPMIKQMILDTEAKLNDFTSKWKPSIDFRRVPVDNNNTKSLESLLMKNKYRDKIYLGRFASLKPNDKTHNASITTDQTFMAAVPLVDEMFGLYSPFDALSFRGLGCLIQKYTNAVQSCGADASEKLKATVYIMLRFFDICCVHLSNSVASMANPLENYLIRTDYNKANLDASVTPTPLTSTTSTQGINNKQLVAKIIKQISESFTKELTTTTIDDLLKLLNQDFEMFKTLLKIYELHRDIFERKTMQLSHQNYHPDRDEIYNSFNLLIEFCKLQDILLALCYSYYNSTLYHLDEYNSLDYLELLLLFLDHQEWIDQGYGYEKVLLVATDCAFNMGLNRWEFYVGVDEAIANRRRKAWWKVYCLEKFFSLKMGRLSTIDDTKVNCLLPEPMRRAGFIDLRDFINRVGTYRPHQSVFDNMSIEDSRIYGVCAETIIVSHFYSNVLYSDDYTSIRTVAMPQFIRERYLSEIFDQCGLTKKKLKVIEGQMEKLFICARTPRESETAVPGDDKYKSSEFVITNYFYSSLFLKSSFTLISRLTGFPGNPKTNEKIREYSKEIYDLFNRCSDDLLTLETSYEIWRQFKLYSFIFVMISFNMDNKNFFVNVNDIIKVFRIFKRILNFAGQLEEFRLMDPHICQNQTLQEFERNLTMLTILIRVLVLDYMLRSDLSAEEVKESMKSSPYGTDVSDMVVMFVDHKSYLYDFVLQPVQETGFHLSVQQLLENVYALSFPKDIGSSNDSMANMKCKNSTRFSSKDYRSNNMNDDVSSKSTMTDEASMYSNQDRATTSHSPINKVSLPNKASTSSLSGATVINNIPVNGIINGESSNISVSKPEQTQNRDGTMGHDHMNPDDGNNLHNMGTVEDFLNNTDLNDLYKSLWNDNFLDMM